MAFSFLQRGSLSESARQLSLSSYVPSITLENLVPGIDNIRHDVFLSSKFSEVARTHILKLIVKHGNVEELVMEDPLSSRPILRPPARLAGSPQVMKPSPAFKDADPAEFKRIVAELHIAALNRAKFEDNASLDLLFRLAVLKFLRSELMNQFNQAVERCRARVKQYESPRHAVHGSVLQSRERFARFQIN